MATTDCHSGSGPELKLRWGTQTLPWLYRVHPPGQKPPRQTPTPWQTFPLGRQPLGRHLPAQRQNPSPTPTATTADGRHITGILFFKSCSEKISPNLCSSHHKFFQDNLFSSSSNTYYVCRLKWLEPIRWLHVFLAEPLQTALLFKWKYFFTKSHDISQYLRISSILIGWYSGHMT